MGYLLKEALKTLCGVNQWSYAVFWKIGCQNPKLLIWEECYYGPITYSGFPPMHGIDNPNFAFHELQGGFQGGERVQLLVNKMMLDNHVNVVGEGLVGRAAFTGNYHWILSQNFTKEVHPPEVLNEMRQQISAGMQTVAVVPVLPHGVVQLGSSSAIMENVQFVNDVKTLILQLGCVPGVLFSDNFATKELPSEIGAVVGLENSGSTGSSGKSKGTYFTSYVTDNYNQKDDSTAIRRAGQTSNVPVMQIPDNLQSTGPNFQNFQPCVNSKCQSQVIPDTKPTTDRRSELENGIKGAKIISSDPELWRNEEASFYIPGSIAKQQLSVGPSATISGSRYLEDKMSVDAAVVDRVNCSRNESSAFLSKWATAGLISSSHSGSSSVPSQNRSSLSNVLSGLSEISNRSSLSSAHGLVKKDNLPVHIAESAFQNGAQYNTQVSTSSFANNLATGHLFPSSSNKDNSFKDNTCIQIDLDRGKEEMENDLFHGISVRFSQSDEHNNLRGCSPGFAHDNKKHEYGYQNIGHAQFEDAYVQSHSGDDLFDVLGVNFKSSLFDESWNNFAFDGPGTNSENLDKNKYPPHKLRNACSETQMVNERRLDSGTLSVTSTDHLLDAVVSRVQAATKQNSDDNLSCRTSLTKISSSYAPSVSTSPRQADTSNHMHDKWVDLSKSLTKGAFNTCSFSYEPCKEDSGNFSQSKSLYGSQSSSWVEQGPEIKHSATSSAFSKRSAEISKSNRKRLKPGENPRPRPKDRQMIQDRVKELREIVPNSAKCSIDALLERTIKHMLFLQSVTKHADKLKQTGESKIINKEGGLLLKDNFEGGATWAYEVGSQSMVCPIIVEDLNPPRQMLVEMLCEERGLFLEIADIVRGLGLTILKGVMETRNDKIWARFAVEANRDVTRMEIFISLVRLLEQTVKSGSASGNCVGNDGVMAHQPFHPAVSIPATGRPCSFQ